MMRQAQMAHRHSGRDGVSLTGACLSKKAGPHHWGVYSSTALDGDCERPLALFIHGVGASMHSFWGLAGVLQDTFDILAIDLPGHARTRSPRWSAPTLDTVSEDVAALLDALGVRPAVAVGHSAGAAILLRMTLRGLIAPESVVSINGALSPFAGAAGFVFPLMAKALHFNPLVAPFAAASARDRRRVERLIAETGSNPPEDYVNEYWRLMQRPSHIAGALAMMAHWDLSELSRSLSRIESPVLFIVGAGDRAVPPDIGRRAAEITPNGDLSIFENLGHLAHEENAVMVATEILEFASRVRRR